MSILDGAWDNLVTQIDALLKDARAVSAVNVNSTSVKTKAKQLVQYYFRTARPELSASGVTDVDLQTLDDLIQDLNGLALGNNPKTRYVKNLKLARTEAAELGLRRDILMGRRSNSEPVTATPQQQKIIGTLAAMLPAASVSFSQAISDLNDPGRTSYRGTASELREVLREIIDHLAPDEAVAAAPGFQLEKGRPIPTMKQKVRFIMKSRGHGSTVSATSEDALATVDGLARSLYNRGSMATHAGQEKAEVNRIRLYTEALLIDILELD